MNRKQSRTGSAGASGSASLSSCVGATTAWQSTSSRQASGSRNALTFGSSTSSTTAVKRGSSQPITEGLTLPSAMPRSLTGQGTTAGSPMQAGLSTQLSRSDSIISGLSPSTISQSATSGVSGTGLVAFEPIHITPVSAGVRSLFDDDSGHLRPRSREAAAILQQLEHNSAVASRTAHRRSGPHIRQVQSQSYVCNQEGDEALHDLARTDISDATSGEDMSSLLPGTKITSKSSRGSSEARHERVGSSSSVWKFTQSAGAAEESSGKAALSSEGASAGTRSSRDKVTSRASKVEHKSSKRAFNEGSLLRSDEGLKGQQNSFSASRVASFGEEQCSGTTSPFRTEWGSLENVEAEKITSSASTTKHTIGKQAEGLNRERIHGSTKESHESERQGSSLTMEENIHGARRAEESRDKTNLSLEKASVGFTTSPASKAEENFNNQEADQADSSLLAANNGLKGQQDGLLVSRIASLEEKQHTDITIPFKTLVGSLNEGTAARVTSSSSTTKCTFGNQGEGRIQEKGFSSNVTNGALHTGQQDKVVSGAQEIASPVKVGGTETETDKPSTTGIEQNIGTSTHGTSFTRTTALGGSLFHKDDGLKGRQQGLFFTGIGSSEEKFPDATTKPFGGSLFHNDGLRAIQQGLFFTGIGSSEEKQGTDTTAPVKTKPGSLGATTTTKVTSSSSTTKCTLGNQADGHITEKGLSSTVTDGALYTGQQDTVVSRAQEIAIPAKFRGAETETDKPSTTGIEQNIGTSTHGTSFTRTTAIGGSLFNNDDGLKGRQQGLFFAGFGSSGEKQGTDSDAPVKSGCECPDNTTKPFGGSLFPKDDGPKGRQQALFFSGIGSSEEKQGTDTTAQVKTGSGSLGATTATKVTSSSSTTKCTFGNQAEGLIQKKGFSSTVTNGALHTGPQDTVVSGAQDIASPVKVGGTETETDKPSTTGIEQNIGTSTHGTSFTRTTALGGSLFHKDDGLKGRQQGLFFTGIGSSEEKQGTDTDGPVKSGCECPDTTTKPFGGSLFPKDDGPKGRQQALFFTGIGSSEEKQGTDTAAPVKTGSGSLGATTATKVTSSSSTTKNTFGSQSEGRIQEKGFSSTVTDDALSKRQQDTVVSVPEETASPAKNGGTETEIDKPTTPGIEQHIGTATHGTSFTRTTGLSTATVTDANVPNKFVMSGFPSHDFFGALKTPLSASTTGERSTGRENNLFACGKYERMKQAEEDIPISMIKDQLCTGPTPSHEVTSGGLGHQKVSTVTEEKITTLAQAPKEEKAAISEPVLVKSERPTISPSEKSRYQVVALEPEVNQEKGSAQLEVSQRKVAGKPEAPTLTDASSYSYSSGAQVTVTQKSTSRWKNNTPVQQSHFNKIEGSNYQKTFDSSLLRSDQASGGGTSEFQTFHITSSSGPTQAPTEKSTGIVKGRLELTPDRTSTYTSQKEAPKAEKCASATGIALTPLPELPTIASPKVSSEELQSTVKKESSSRIEQHGSWQSPVVERTEKTHTYLGSAAALFELYFSTPQADASSINTELSHSKEGTVEVKQAEMGAGSLLAPSLEPPSYSEGPFTSSTQNDTSPLTPAGVGKEPGPLEQEKPLGEDGLLRVHMDSSLIQYAGADDVLEKIVREVEKKILASSGNNFEPLPHGTFPVRSSKGIESLGSLKYETYAEGLLLRESKGNLLGRPMPEAPTVSERQPASCDEQDVVASHEGAYAGALKEPYAEAQEKDRERQQEKSVSPSEQASVLLSKETATRTEASITTEGDEAQETGGKFEMTRTWCEDREMKVQDIEKARKILEEQQDVQYKQREGHSEQAVAKARGGTEVNVEDNTYAGHEETQEAARVEIKQEEHAVQPVNKNEIGKARPIKSLDALGRKKRHEAVEKGQPKYGPLGTGAQDEANKEALRSPFAPWPEEKKSTESKVYVKKHETGAVPENTVRRFIAAAIEEAAARRESRTVKRYQEYSFGNTDSSSSESSLSKETDVAKLKLQQEKEGSMPQHLASKSITELIEEMINQNVRGNDARTCLDLVQKKVGSAPGTPSSLPAEHRPELRQPREVAVFYQTASTAPRFVGEVTHDFRGSPLAGVRKSETRVEQSQLEITSQMEQPLSSSSTSGRGARCSIRKIEPGVLTYLVEVAPSEKAEETQSDMVMAEEQLLVSEIFEHLTAPSPRALSTALALNEARAASAAKSSESLSGIRNAYAAAVAAAVSARVLGLASPVVPEGVRQQAQKEKFLEAAQRARRSASSLSLRSHASVEDYIVHSMLASELRRKRADKFSGRGLKQENAFPRRTEPTDALSNVGEANTAAVPPPSPADQDEETTESEQEVVVSKPTAAPRGAGWKVFQAKAPAATSTVAETKITTTKETVAKSRTSVSRSESSRATEMAGAQTEQDGIKPQAQLVKDASSKTCGLCDNRIRAEESFEAFICLGMHDLSPNLVPIPPEVRDVIKLRIATDNDVRDVVSLPWKEPQWTHALAAEVSTRQVVCPNGFYVAVDTAKGHICGAASIIFFDEEVASCGFFFLHKDYSFQDVGALLWNQVLHATSGKNLFTLLPLPESEQLLSLYHLPSSTATGILSGPIRVSWTALERKVLVLDYKDKYFEALVSYDKHVFGFSRRRLLAASVHEAGFYICVATRNERNVCGYGGIQRDDAGRLVLRWLFADDGETAESLLSCLVASCSKEDDIGFLATFFLRSVATRPILDKVNARELKPWSMVYTKREPVHSYGRIVCLTSV